jgi:hypothetical protein
MESTALSARIWYMSLKNPLYAKLCTKQAYGKISIILLCESKQTTNAPLNGHVS